MKNELLHIGPVTIYGYGLMIAIGVLAAYFSAEYRAKKYKLDPDRVFSLVICAVVGGMVGAKLLYFLTEFKEIIRNPSLLLDLSNGFVVYGGIIGGVLLCWIYCRVKGMAFLKYFDLVMPSVALAQGFGRIGCFLAGCCYGKETSGSLGIVFHDSAYAPNGVKLIPTQLISSGLDFLHFFVLIWFARRAKRDGQVAGLYLTLYSAGRFILEFFRGDLIRGSVGVLSTSQFISIFTCLAGVAMLLWAGRKPAATEAVSGGTGENAEETGEPAAQEPETEPEISEETEEETTEDSVQEVSGEQTARSQGAQAQEESETL